MSPLGRRSFLAGALATGEGRTLAREVRDEMRWAWAQYRSHAWGKDEIKPLTS